MSENKRHLLPKIGGGIYILPNLLTTGNLFFGFFSIVKSMQGEFLWAAGAVFLAAIFDVLDGRVARLTKSMSDFGVQYDSLCDLVSFGLAPSFLVYQYALHSYGRLGWVLCFIYLACGALRLARFNVQSFVGKSNGDFNGLPIPIAACLIASFISLVETVKVQKEAMVIGSWTKEQAIIFLDACVPYCLIAFSALLAFLMVSNVTYRSHKSISFRLVRTFHILAGLVVVVGLIAYHPPLFGFSFFFFYVLFGPVEFFLGWKKASNDEDVFHIHDD